MTGRPPSLTAPRSMYGKGLRTLSIATVALLALALSLVFFYAPLDADQLETARAQALGPLTTGSTAVELALGVARDHAVKARDALDGADGLDPDVGRTLGRLVDGLVLRER